MISLSAATLAGSELDCLYSICASQADYWRVSGDLDPGTMTRAGVEAILRDEATAEGSETLVARDEDGVIVGFAELLLQHPIDGHPWIGLLIVDSRQSRQGHGRAIVTAIEERFHRMGATALRLGVLTSNEPALLFWQALGYRQIDLRPDLAKGRPTRVMEKAV
ncbi:GNAT family N-acetyltransferase [Actinoplanes sp. LDG1-06]|uniref:GNAT family N-acetyltransferase n=1 Tax=Paractinoplanes ovalisporus TaxID=2810368 RepID=A0ABS2AUC4_9ACTN|nr:GNAT family N-acetyltransferase [Actinoplanes ovalisporus]MBM2623450.1 GNAT family N-acetyltransferase [Actinoplanes ovalisporus]